MNGRFITFEGIDGAGKSTHIDALVARLRARGASVVCTREPGGTPLAEALRALLLERGMDALTEALLVFAARRDHVREVIAPALARGQTVVCDRFTDATFAYQGAGGQLPPSQLATLEDWVHGGLQPALTLWLDLPGEVAAARRAGRGDGTGGDRFERQDAAYFERVRAGYAQRAGAAPQRFARIDADRAREDVWRQIEAELERRGW